MVRGRGLMIGVEFPGPVADIRKRLLNEFHIFTGFSGSNILRLLPPLSLSVDEATRFATALATLLKQ
jgi:acetylornithine aminotransferase